MSSRLSQLVKILLFFPIIIFGQIDVSIEDVNGVAYNTSITIPINTSDVSGQNVISFLTKITYDPDFMDITGVSRTGTLSEIWSNPTLNTSNPGEIQIAAYGFQTLEGEGVLLNLEVDILESDIGSSAVDFIYFYYNEGFPTVDTMGGSVAIGEIIIGCMDVDALNYNPDATQDSDNCIYYYDCNGIANGPSVEDNCGVCDNNPNNDCTLDCLGNPGGTAVEDDCGVCDGNNLDIDECGICFGDGISESECDCFGNVLDCEGVCGGTAEFDNCGECGGDNSSCIPTLTVSIPDLSYYSIDDIGYVPVNTTNLSNLYVSSYYTRILFNSDVLTISGVSLDGTLSSGMGSPTINTSVDGQITIAAYGFSPLEGEGVLFNLDVDFIGGSGESSALDFDFFMYNEGYPQVTLIDGSIGLGEVMFGCTDQAALNYDSNATSNDGSCIYYYDCNNIPNGPSSEDNCSVCDDNPSNDCIQDCNGVWGGSAELDICGECEGDGFSCTDCAGIPGGDSFIDSCNTCVPYSDTSCVLGCDENWYNDGIAPYIDDCGVCDGNNLDIDECGLCFGDGIPEGECDCSGNILDCEGVCGGTSELDNCGMCNGDNSSCIPTTNVSISDFTYYSSDEIGFIPVNTTDLTDLYVTSYYTRILFDPNIINIESVDIAGTLSSGMGNPTLNTSVDGQITIAAYGFAALEDEGVLLNLFVNFIGDVGDNSFLVFDFFMYNEGYPQVTTTNGSVGIGDVILGCTDEVALNYDSNATSSDGSCVYYYDCAGNPNGDSLEDNCGVCDTYVWNDCEQDCADTWGGDLVEDECGICGGDNTSCVDCAGVPNGDSYEDVCGVCDDDPVNDCPVDCFGTPGGPAIIDDCGVCDGNNVDLDECGICFGEGIPEGDCDCSGNNIIDCNGLCGGVATFDNCGVCEGDNSSCTPVVDISISDYIIGIEQTTALISIDVSDLTNLNVISIYGQINYNSDVIQISNIVSQGSIIAEWGASPVINDAILGETTFAVYGAFPLSGSGELLFLEANIIGETGDSTPLDLSLFIFNEGWPESNIENGILAIGGHYGCTDPDACNYDENSTLDNGTCLVYDCLGECGGIAAIDCNGDCDGNLVEDECGICNGDNSTCLDCEGIPNGASLIDNCGICDSDLSNDCTQACDGVWGGSATTDCFGACGGTAVEDECGICGGDNSTCTDCAGTVNGSAVADNCGICDSDSTNDCVPDCDGVWGGTDTIDCFGICGGIAVEDECGICGGDNSSCTDCAGVPYGDAIDLGCGCGESGPSGCDNMCGSTSVEDECGICGGDNSTCTDCAGTVNGSAVADNCGICDSDSTNDCVPDCDGVWGGTDTIDCFGICGGIAVEDECGICGGDNSSCTDCAGVPNGNAIDLGCGCGESGPSGCDNMCGSTAIEDECGVCDGNNADLDACGICFGGNTDCAAFILSIDDIPADQGGRVYITFEKSPADTNEPNRIEGYQLERLDGDEWVGIEFYVAYAQDYYIFEGTTLVDSTYQNNAITTFRIIASMDEGIWISDVHSGYSVDNLSPEVPEELTGEYVNSEVQLLWSASSASDFDKYYIYRNNAFIAESQINHYIDMEIDEDMIYLYNISAIDIHENESGLSNLISVEIPEFTIDQQVNLNALQLNLMSTHVAYDGMAVSDVLADVDILMCNDDNGNYYVPSFDIYQIGEYDLSEGYYIFLNGTDNQVFEIEGANQSDVTISLNALQVNLMPYLLEECMPTEEVFEGITDNILIVQDDNGLYYVPSYGVMTLTEMCPGEAYEIFLIGMDDIEFQYPQLDELARTQSESSIYWEEYVHNSKSLQYDYKQTGISHPVIITQIEGEVEIGDELVAYAHGEVVGASRIIDLDSPIVISAWGSFNYYGIQLPGYDINDAIELRLWSENGQTELRVVSDLDVNEYGNSPLSIGAATAYSKSAVVTDFKLSPAYPNPFNPITTINFILPELVKVKLEVYNMNGQLVNTLIDGRLDIGYHSVIWDGSNNSSGIYFVKMISGDFVKTQKLMLVK